FAAECRCASEYPAYSRTGSGQGTENAGRRQESLMPTATKKRSHLRALRFFVPEGIIRPQLTCRSLPSQYGARNSRLRILPDGLRGSTSRKSTDFGTL